MALTAYDAIVDRLCILLNDVWPVDVVFVGQVRQAAAPPYAVLSTERIERERVGPRVVEERYDFTIFGVFLRQPGDREESFLVDQARRLTDALTANATVVADLANGLEVREVAFPTLDELEDACGVSLSVRVLSHVALEPADA